MILVQLLQVLIGKELHRLQISFLKVSSVKYQTQQAVSEKLGQLVFSALSVHRASYYGSKHRTAFNSRC